MVLITLHEILLVVTAISFLLLPKLFFKYLPSPYEFYCKIASGILLLLVIWIPEPGDQQSQLLLQVLLTLLTTYYMCKNVMEYRKRKTGITHHK
ncbi:hypothetical protein [Aridibaculum aurantiacum]|uniref:hypothetical protein n=1 Tax=Aridibaculum aurantiacum TaxID=2810307 RepID=UPI001A9564E1|nr:hypothetical protein [Aridibaculum aurantiacum]